MKPCLLLLNNAEGIPFEWHEKPVLALVKSKISIDVFATMEALQAPDTARRFAFSAQVNFGTLC